MMELVYQQANASQLRDMLREIWGRLNEVNQLHQILGTDYQHFVAVGDSLRSTTDQVPSNHLFDYDEMGEGGLLVAVAIIHHSMEVLSVCRDYRHTLEQHLRNSAADDIRRLQAGPAGKFLPKLSLER